MIIGLTEKLVKNMKWYDVSLLKGSTFFLTLFLVTLWPQFQRAVFMIPWYIHLILGLAIGLPLIIKMFK